MKRKMQKMAKRVAALTATMLLILGTCLPVLAEDATIPGSGPAVILTDATTLNIPKTLKVTNPALAQVAGPGLQLSYTLASTTVAAGTSVSAGTEGPIEHVQSGPAGGLTLVSGPAFTVSDTLNASASGAANVKNIVLTTDLTKFTEPGIYRYTLTDTTTAETLAAAGVERNENFTNVRYVDVYIQWDSTGDLVVEGYVVGSDNDANGVLVKETFDTSTTTDDTQDASYVVYDTPDVFNTYNLTLTKAVTGAMGDHENAFPFAITVSDSGRAFYAAKGTAPASDSTLNQAAHTTALSTTLAHGNVYYIAGLRKNDTVAYTETNNTQESYSVSISGVTDTSEVLAGYAATNVAPGGTKAMSAVTAPNAQNVTFENNLGSISPTGVVTRFGPYAGMVVLAGLLMALRKKAKAER